MKLVGKKDVVQFIKPDNLIRAVQVKTGLFGVVWRKVHSIFFPDHDIIAIDSPANYFRSFGCIDCAPVIGKRFNGIPKPISQPVIGAPIPKATECPICHEVKPVNRTGLCYRCFCISNILEWAHKNGVDWLPGDEHPAWCQCDLPEHGKRINQNLN